MALVIGLTYYLTTKSQDIRQRASGITSIEYGINTHINATGASGYWENLTPDAFNKTVDDLIANNQKWIRLNILPWETVTGGSINVVNWNEEITAKYVKAISYAKSKGLKVYIVTSTPDFANSFQSNDFIGVTTLYHKGLAERLKGNVDVWQIFNEADIHNFKGYASISDSDLTDNYLSDLKTNIGAAITAIKIIDPNIKFATNVLGYPLDTNTFNRWDKYFNSIASTVDILSLDIYPRWYEDISVIKSNVIGVESKFQKPVIIAETGFPSNTLNSSEKIQADIMVKTIAELRQALPMAIFLYQYSDTLPSTDRTESSFGIVTTNGTKKESFDPIMHALSTPTGILFVKTDPAVGVTITIRSKETGQIVSTNEWAISYINLPVGQYSVEFTNPKNLSIYDKKVILPPSIDILILDGQTTTMVADLTTATYTLTPPQAQPTTVITPTGAPITPSPTPSLTPSPSPTPIVSTGTLNVTTGPSVNSTINIVNYSTGKIVLSNTNSIYNAVLPTGNYYVTFSTVRSKRTPRTAGFAIKIGQITQIYGDYLFGKTTVVYK